jgi:RNA polymerase sigma-70 factor (ECF subfamily)
MNTERTEQSEWFAREVEPHEPALRTWLRRLVPISSDVDDVVQESYVRLVRARRDGNVGHPRSYLFRTARNFAFDLFRRRRVVSIEGVADLDELSVCDEGADIAESVSRRQELNMLAEAVRELPDRCRQVLTLRLVQGMSHKQIAETMKISEHTVKAQLAKGVRRCADFFETHGDAALLEGVREEAS